MATWHEIYQTKGIIQKEIMPVVTQLASYLKNNSYVLDSGCGTGRHSLFLAEKGHYIEAFDNSPKAVAVLQDLASQCNFKTIKAQVHDLNNPLPFEKDQFDAVVSTLVIEHGVRKDIQKWCIDVKQILKPNGLLALAVPATTDPRALTGTEIEPGTRINTAQTDGDIPHHFFTDTEIESLFSDFVVVYKKLQLRPSVTATIVAQHWEYLLRKSKVS